MALERSKLGNFLYILLEVTLLIGGIYLLEGYGGVLIRNWPNSIWYILAYFVVIITLLNLVTRFVKGLYRRRNYAKRRGTKNFIFGVENIRKLLIAAIVVVTVLAMIGIDFRTLFTSLSIVAAAIAIVSKEFVNDLIVGIYYSFNDIFEVGDYVQINQRKGRVVDIGLLKVSLLNDNDDIAILPNSKVYAEEIVNYTRRDVRVLNIDFEMDIRIVNDLGVLEKELIASLSMYAESIEPGSYRLKIVKVLKDVVELKFQFRLQGALTQKLQRDTKRMAVRRIYSYVTTLKPNA